MARGRLLGAWTATMAGLAPVAALAEEAPKAGGGYGGADYGWFIIIGLILVYGVYDTFLKKA